ncbi:MAG: hypothetical protein ACWA5A_04965 [Marinibacterium sp.]
MQTVTGSGLKATLAVFLLAGCADSGGPATGQPTGQPVMSAPGSRIYRLDDNRFEVVGNSGRGYILFWCGASHYARRALGASWRDKITVVRGLGQSEATGQRSAVQFTLTPDALGITPIASPTPNAYEVGDSRTITSANGDCRDLIFPWPF